MKRHPVFTVDQSWFSWRSYSMHLLVLLRYFLSKSLAHIRLIRTDPDTLWSTTNCRETCPLWSLSSIRGSNCVCIMWYAFQDRQLYLVQCRSLFHGQPTEDAIRLLYLPALLVYHNFGSVDGFSNGRSKLPEPCSIFTILSDVHTCFDDLHWLCGSYSRHASLVPLD